jgi:TRIAD3 protein (E3 ubiquitin-protein ligase RNF216)
MSHIIDISSSPEPGPSHVQQPPQTPKVKLSTKRQRTRIGPVIELTDSESDGEDVPARSRHLQRIASPRNATPGSSSRPGRTPTFTQIQPKVGGFGSLQNIPSQNRRLKTPTAKAVPLFFPSDEENEPPARVRLAADQQPPFGAIIMDNGPAPLQITRQESSPVEQALELEPERNPLLGYVARVLEIIPDVDPDHLLALVTKFEPSLQGGVVEHVLHVLFEDSTYPKVDKKGKGKRKQTEQEAKDGGIEVPVGSPPKKVKIDYGDKQRPFRGGVHYSDLALVRILLYKTKDLPTKLHLV